ncbi:MAG: hypothetical protein EP343_33970 [Deltaproteobacteria bacterium]|nr:MAG: hypothetical protein EP343_33970 [Deltaproteobacteria bacterium]
MNRLACFAFFLFVLGVAFGSCSQPEQPEQESVNAEPVTQPDAATKEALVEPEKPSVLLWPSTKPPALAGDLFDEFPWLKETSTWFSPGCGDGQPSEARNMGDYAVGNGYSFSLTGYACPLHTLHAMTGPTYQKDGGFFADTWMELRNTTQRYKVEKGYLLRVRHTPILVTQEDMGQVSLQTVTWAPMGISGSSLLQQHVLLRMVEIRNQTKSALTSLKLSFPKAIDKLRSRQRSLVVLRPNVTVSGDTPEIVLGELAAGKSVRVVLAYVMTNGEESLSEVKQALGSADVGKLLVETRDHWRAWIRKAARLTTPDPRVNDLYTGMLVTTLVQRTYNGAISPMSRYTNFWTRDIVGPVRFWLAVGLWDEAKGLLEFYYKAASAKGVLANSYSLTLPDPQPKPPDWSKLPGLQGRTAAEAPSYLSLMHSWYRLFTGESRLSSAHYDMLLHSVLGQNIDAKGQLPFSGDETFRSAMSMTYGLPLEHKYEDCCVSANSSMLFVAAAEALRQESRLLGKDKDAEALKQKADVVRRATEAFFWKKEGYYLPFLDRTQPKEHPPYPDISTQALWVGYHQPEQTQALEHVRTMVEKVGKPDGMWQLPAADSYKNYLGLGLGEGVYTGMTPGYVLSNLSKVEHPTAADLFNALPRIVSSSGNVAEYQVYSDHSAFQFLYDQSGRQSGDTTARFRPWEGGILMEAMVHFLTGFAPTATGDSFVLVPRLPNHWPSMKWEGLRFQTSTFDLSMEEQDSVLTIKLSTSSTKPLAVQLQIPLGTKEAKSVQVNQVIFTYEKLVQWKPFGHTRLQFPTQSVSQTKPLEVSITYK